MSCTVPSGNSPSPGLEVSIFDAFTAFGYVRLPVYRDVNGLRQTAKYNLQFGLTCSTGGTRGAVRVSASASLPSW